MLCRSVSPLSQAIIPPDQPGSARGSKVGKDGEIRERKGLEEHRRLERPRFDINSCCLSGIKEIEVAVTSDLSLLGKCQLLTFILLGKVVRKISVSALTAVGAVSFVFK